MSKPKTKNQTGKPVQKSVSSGSWKTRISLLVVLMVTAFLYYPTVHYEFVNWDDDVNVTQNPNVQQLTRENVRNMFTETVIGGYTPLTTLTFAVEKHFFGLNPKPFHIDNLILHLLCTALVFIFMKLMGINLFVSFIVAMLFGIHPMRTESVAWVTERKDVLYTLFYLLSVIFYIHFRKSGHSLLYLLSMGSFILSLLSKIQAVSLPLALIMVDYYLEKRFSFKQIPDKIPFFILSLVTGVAGIYFLKQTGSLETGTILPFFQRFFIGSYSLCVYIVKAVIPFEMTAIYPFPSKLTLLHYLSMPAVLAIAWIVWRAGKSHPEIIFGSLFFFVNVVFMLQVVGAGQGFIADRFTYVPYIGLFFILAFLADRLATGNLRYAVMAGGTAYLLVLTVATHNRMKVWQNSETLFADVIRKYPKVAVAHNNLGKYYREHKQYDKAIASYNIALEIKPDGYATWSNRGKAYYDTGRTEEALADFNKSIEINGEYAEARSNRGAALATKGLFKESLSDFDKAIQLEPRNKAAWSNRSLAHYSLKEFRKAADDVTAYLRIEPDDPDMLNLRGLCYSQLNNHKEALADFDQAIRLRPSQGVFWQNRSFFYFKSGDKASALRDIQKAQELGIKVNPEYLRTLEK